MVIAVMTLLMGLLLPVLGRVRRQGRALACRSNLREWGVALHSYAAANDGKVPSIWDGPVSGDGDPDGYWHYWYARHRNQTDPNEVLLCPSARRATEQGWEGGTFRAWRSRLSTTGSPVICSYGRNLSVGQKQSVPLRDPWSWWAVDVKSADRIPLFFDCASATFHAIGDNPYDMGPPPQREGYRDPVSGGQAYRVCINRHEGGINMVFLDGSVRKVGLKELWTLTWRKQYNTANRWTKGGEVPPEDWPEWMRGFKGY